MTRSLHKAGAHHLQHLRAPNVAATDCALPATEQLLVSGGDARIQVDPLSGTNRYGCATRPDPDSLAFGSSTASVISVAGFTAANRLRETLCAALAIESAPVLYAREMQRVRTEFRALCELPTVSALDIVFATSGTDLHLIATQMVLADQTCDASPDAVQRVRIVMIEAAETGREVPKALAGQPFGMNLADVDAERSSVTSAVEVMSVRVRQADGSARLAAEVDAEVTLLVEQGVVQGQRILLILVDVSKSGLIAPSPACADTLKRRYASLLEVLVDACQFRLAPATLRAYLGKDFMVAVTGSKFMGGPTFSGALLIPAALGRVWRTRPVPQVLAAYVTNAEWPVDWNAAGLPALANFGLLLRWQAALVEMQAFHALSEIAVDHFLNAFAQAIVERLSRDPVFELLPAPALERKGLESAHGWDQRQTIFPFILRHPATAGAAIGRPLTETETARIYQHLQQPMDSDQVPRYQLGQPMQCGEREGVPVTALRLCLSARLVTEALVADGEQADGSGRVIGQALRLLDRIAGLVRAAG